MDNLARKFYEAFYTGRFDRDPGDSVIALTLEDAYRIQEQVIQMRISVGEKPIGYKIGCTSVAIRNQFGLDKPVIGRLMSPHVYTGHKVLSLEHYVNCAIEPEFVFKINKDLTGESLDRDFLRDSIEYVAAGIEVHNYRFWFTPPTSQELIASNGIHACLIVGNEMADARQLDFMTESFRVLKDGTLVAKGNASEIMGDPINSLKFLVIHLSERGRTLEAGQVVIPGSPVELIEIEEKAALRIEISRVGAVTADFLSNPVISRP